MPEGRIEEDLHSTYCSKLSSAVPTQVGVWIQQAQAKGQGKDRGKDKDQGKRAGLYSAQKRSAPGFLRAVELECYRDPPTPPMSRRRKDSVDSSVPNSSRASSPAASSSSERRGEVLTPVKTEGVEEVVKTEDDGLTISSSDHRLPTANFVCNVTLNKGRRRTLAKGLQLLNDHDVALQALCFPNRCLTTVGPKRAVVFTSEPRPFQDSIFHTVDVGREARGNWTPNGSRKVLQVHRVLFPRHCNATLRSYRRSGFTL